MSTGGALDLNNAISSAITECLFSDNQAGVRVSLLCLDMRARIVFSQLAIDGPNSFNMRQVDPVAMDGCVQNTGLHVVIKSTRILNAVGCTFDSSLVSGASLFDI